MTTIKTILFPTDLSSTSDYGLHYATSLAKDNGAKLLIVHVEEPATTYAAGEYYYGIADPNSDQLAEMLGKVKPDDPSVPFEHRLVTGDPANTIVKLAEQEQVDLIVMGTHGRTGLIRLLLGSVAEAIVRKAACPVLTFTAPAAERAAE